MPVPQMTEQEELDQIVSGWSDEKLNRYLSTQTPEQVQNFIDVREGRGEAPSATAGSPAAQAELFQPGETTIQPGPSTPERARAYLGEAPQMVGGVAGSIGGSAVGPAGTAAGGVAGETAGATIGEYFKGIENPYLRGVLTGGATGAAIGAGAGTIFGGLGAIPGAIGGGIIGAIGGAGTEYLAEQAEQARREAGSLEGPEGFYEPGRTQTLGEAAEQGFKTGVINEALGFGMGTAASKLRSMASPPTQLSEIATPGGKPSPRARTFINDPTYGTPIGAFDVLPSEAQLLGMEGTLAPHAMNKGMVSTILDGWSKITSAGNSPRRAMAERSQDALSHRLEHMMDELGPYDQTPTGRMAMGKKIQEAIEAADDAARKPISDGYDAVFEKVRESQTVVTIEGDIVEGLTVSTTAIQEVIEEFGGMDVLLRLLQDPSNTQFVRTFTKYGKGIPPTIPFQDARNLRSDLGSLLRKHSDPSRAEFLQASLSEGLTKSMVKSARDGGIPEVIPALQELDIAYRGRMEKYYNSIIKGLVGNEEPELLASLAFKKGGDTRTTMVFDALTPTKRTLDSLDPVARRELLAKAEADKNLVRRTAYEDAYARGEEKANPEASFISWWRGMSKLQKQYLGLDKGHQAGVQAYFNLTEEAMPRATIKKINKAGVDLMERGKLFQLQAGLTLTATGAAGYGVGGVAGGAAGLGLAMAAYASPYVVGRLLASKMGTRLLTDATTNLLGKGAPSAADIVKFGARMTEIIYRVESQGGALDPLPKIDYGKRAQATAEISQEIEAGAF